MADVITRLKLDSGEYDSKIKRATQGLLQMEQECRKVGGTLAVLEKDQLDYVRSLGQMETVSRSARGKVSELTAAFTELSVQYKHLTDEEKKGDYGKALSASLNQLKGRINEAKNELADVDKELKGASDATGDWSGMLNQLGGQLGINTNLLSGLTTGTIATTAAVTAGAAAVAMATKAWAEYNDEINRQNTITSVVTGGKGGEDLTMGVRALARTYDVDFRQAIEAANTLMQQFGVTSTEALRLLQDGMQGMIAGDGGKLLAMIQQYAPSFRDAGIEASQLVAIIQNSEGGIFTDQNMNAIVMGIRNIRLMTEQTSKALAQLGIDGEEMTRKLNDGTMTIFEAMQQVSKAIEDAGTSSQAVGQVMQQVFGRQGTAAGTNLAKAIETLNTNLQETKTQTGELGESFVKLNEANERLESTMQDIFGMTGWEDMNNYLKTDLANTLSDVLDIIGGIKKALGDLSSYGEGVWNDLVARFTGEAYKPKGGKGKATVTPKGQDASGQWQWGSGKYDFNYTPTPSAPAPATPANSGLQIVTSGGKVVKVTRDGKDITEDYLKSQKSNTNTPPPKPTVTTPKGGSKGTPWAPIAMGQVTGIDITGRSVNDVTKDIQVAQAKFNAAGDEMGRSMAKAMIEALQKEKDTIMNEGDVTKGGFADAYSHDFGKDIKGVESQMKNADNLAKQGQNVRESWQQAAVAIGSVGNALAGLEDPGAKIVGTVGAAIAQIALGFAQATAASSGAGVFGWIAAVAGGMATMLSTISAIHSATGYANGGVVNYNGGGGVIPGNSYTGDNLRMIGVNSGEIIMNTAQQNNVASALLSRQQGGAVDVQPWVDGEKVYLGMNNTLQRKGKGEIVTTSMLRQKGIL